MYSYLVYVLFDIYKPYLVLSWTNFIDKTLYVTLKYSTYDCIMINPINGDYLALD